jgi:hypothetical protein
LPDSTEPPGWLKPSNILDVSRVLNSDYSSAGAPQCQHGKIDRITRSKRAFYFLEERSLKPVAATSERVSDEKQPQRTIAAFFGALKMVGSV